MILRTIRVHMATNAAQNMFEKIISAEHPSFIVFRLLHISFTRVRSFIFLRFVGKAVTVTYSLLGCILCMFFFFFNSIWLCFYMSGASTSVLLHRHCAVNKSIFVKVEVFFFFFFLHSKLALVYIYCIWTVLVHLLLFGSSNSSDNDSDDGSRNMTTMWNHQVNISQISS